MRGNAITQLPGQNTQSQSLVNNIAGSATHRSIISLIRGNFRVYFPYRAVLSDGIGSEMVRARVEASSGATTASPCGLQLTNLLPADFPYLLQDAGRPDDHCGVEKRLTDYRPVVERGPISEPQAGQRSGRRQGEVSPTGTC